tara:strand:+ start:221 stop:667 length:447 start_codon:yes stop_codon:yes gene_type:complete
MKIFLTLLHSREGTGIQEIERTAVVDKVEVEIETVMVATMGEETVRIMTQAEAVAEEVPEEAVEAEAAEAEEIPEAVVMAEAEEILEAVVMAEAAVVAEDQVAAVNRHSIATIVLQKVQAEVEVVAAITRVNPVTTTDVDESVVLRCI